MEEFAYIPIKPSRIARYVHCAVFAMALMAIGFSGLSWVLKACMALLLLLAGFYWEGKQQSAITGIGYGEQQEWVMVNQEKVAINIQGEQLVLPWLVIIQWKEKESDKQSALALWPDSASADDLRRLKVFLRTGQG